MYLDSLIFSISYVQRLEVEAFAALLDEIRIGVTKLTESRLLDCAATVFDGRGQPVATNGSLAEKNRWAKQMLDEGGLGLQPYRLEIAEQYRESLKQARNGRYSMRSLKSNSSRLVIFEFILKHNHATFESRCKG